MTAAPPGAPAPAQDSGTRERVLDEQLRLVWSHSRLGGVVASAFAVLLAWKLRGVVAPANVVDGWLAAKLAVAGYRGWLGWRHARLGHPGGSRWRRVTERWLIADAVVWGSLGVPAVYAPVPWAAMLVAALACVSCAATFGLQVSLRANAAYVLPMLAPPALLLLTRGDELGWVAGPGLLLLLAMQLGTALRSDRRLGDALRLGWRTEALAAEKDEALTLALHQSAVKTQFLANISHELRTPLHGILGLARLLRADEPGPAIDRRVELIESSGLHLLSLINDLLDISRVEAGRFVMRDEAFDLAAQVRHVAGVYADRAREKGLVFTLSDLIDPPRRARGDPARFRQVLHNLLGNAIKFTERGFIHFQVEAVDAEGMVRCEVSDSGSGIAADDLAHIFDAFRQSGEASALQLDGTGLGLTIARDIARAMGGDITVRSTLGVGSTLCFTARLPPAAEPVARAGAGEAPRIEPGSLVLLAEDDDVNAMIAGAFLESFGLVVERALDGEQAVRAAVRTSGRPALVLMDCRMPVLDGFGATRRIRAAEDAQALPRVPIVALTATAGDADRQQCLDAGMDDFLAKPYSRDELARVLASWLPAPP